MKKLEPGTVVAGRYEVQDLLGEGGQGRVYLAKDTDLRRKVAIKTLCTMEGEAEGPMVAQARFDTEAELVANLHHPNIISVYERGEHEGQRFIVMEYLPRCRTMDEVVAEASEKGEPLDLDLLRAWFMDAAKGLMALHETGAWHRDIKLDNLLVFELAGGLPALKIIDFGLVHNPAADLTRADTYIGTASYIAPEYVFSDDETGDPLDLDHRADIYALGISLYRALTFEKPYPKIVDIATAAAVYYNPDTRCCVPSKLRAGLPPGFDQVTMRMLERYRDKRYQTAAEILEALSMVDKLGPYLGREARKTAPTVKERRASGVGAVADDAPGLSGESPVGSQDIVDVEQPGSAEPLAQGAKKSPEESAALLPQEEAGFEERSSQAVTVGERAPLAAQADGLGEQTTPSGIKAPSEKLLRDAAVVQASAEPQTSGSALERAFEGAQKDSQSSVYTIGSKQTEESRQSQGGAKRLFLLVAAVFAAVMLAGVVLVGLVDKLAPKKDREQISSEWNPSGRAKKSDSDEWMRDIERRKDQNILGAAQTDDLVGKIAYQAPPKPESIDRLEEAERPSPSSGKKKQARRDRRQQNGHENITVPQAKPEPDAREQRELTQEELFAAAYGNLKTFSARTANVPDEGSEQHATQDAVLAAGTVVQARLGDEVASSPAGAPVLAVVTRSVSIGDQTIPVGTEVHGAVDSSQGTRVFVEFKFFKLRSGKTIEIQGVARDRKGRMGIPGKRLVNMGTASSVVADTAAAVGEETGNVLADKVDNTLGQVGIQSSFRSAASKTDKLDAEEDVVVARKGTRFTIYLQGRGE